MQSSHMFFSSVSSDDRAEEQKEIHVCDPIPVFGLEYPVKRLNRKNEGVLVDS